jgi:putative membrane protein
MAQNAQTDLAEITMAATVAQKATTGQARSLAQETSSDHRQVLTRLRSLASTLGVTLPTEPNAQQRSMAASLAARSGSAFDIAYLNDQVAGHQQSIAQTDTEISSGSSPQVVAFAKSYLPAAQKHLAHAQSALSQLTATPNGANTGSGGQAAQSTGPGGTGPGLIVGGLVVVAAAGGMMLRRRRVG